MELIILPNNISIPSNLEEAIIIIKRDIKEESIKYILTLSEDDFIAQSHFSLGMNLRNNWNLWWSKDLAKEYKDKDYPQEKPKIVSFFNDLGIYHADDMSSIIIRSFYRKLLDLDINLESQVKKYIEFWEEQGVKFE